MKKFMSLAAIAAATLLSFTACEKDEDDKTATVDFEGEYWTALIDNPQSYGPLIYSKDEYKWTDAATTLSSECTKADWTQWGLGYGWNNGIAISNYICNDSVASFDKQLSVPVSNGSKNFAVVWDDFSELAFSDGKNHVVKSMKVSPTTYSLRNVQKSCGEGYYFRVVITGVPMVESKVDVKDNAKSIAVDLAKGTNYMKDWETIDLSSLGAVNTLTFTFEGSDGNDWGLLTPKYVAIDDIVVEL